MAESEDLYAAVAPLPERFNLAHYYLQSNLDEGRGDDTALIVGDEARSYAQVAEGAARFAGALRRAGVRPEERVLIVLPDGFEFAEVFFGVLRAGGVFAMVNPLLKAADFEYYLGYSKARVAVVHESVLPEIGKVAREAPLLERLFVVGRDAGDFASYGDALAAVDPAEPECAIEPTGPDDLAGWLFTSGSTGKPKACVHTHADFAYNTETYARRVVRYSRSDRCLGVPKLFFGYATGTNLMFPFRVGASSVLFPGRSTADELFDQIAAHRPTLLTSVPTMINNMLRSPRFEQTDLTSLRVCLSAGEALPSKLYEEWKERTGVEILDGIGSAEMFHIYVSNYLDDVKVGSLGKVVPGYETQIVGPDGTPVPDGEPGRLRVRGGSTALCYWADKAKTRESFQGEWCTSADVFRRDADGYHYYEGRTDDLIKVSGIWTSPLEIENTLLAHPSVREVCVVGHEDEQRLVKPFAFVALAEGCEGCDELATELKAWVKEHLAPHKYPRWFEWRAALPRNDRGKVSRKDLVAELAPTLIFMHDLAKLTWQEARERFGPDLVALQPVGATEPHGPHLPLDTDVTIARAQALRAAELLAAQGIDSLVLPTIAYGLTHFTDGFEGRISLRPGTLWSILEDVVESLQEQGVRRIVFVNAHLEPAHIQVLRGVAGDNTERTKHLAQVIFADNTRRRWAGTLGDEFKSGDCHAGRYESSIVLAADPAAVREDERARLEPHAIELMEKMRAGVKSFKAAGADRAYCGDPASASADEGNELIESLAEMVRVSVVEAWPDLVARANA